MKEIFAENRSVKGRKIRRTVTLKVTTNPKTNLKTCGRRKGVECGRQSFLLQAKFLLRSKPEEEINNKDENEENIPCVSFSKRKSNRKPKTPDRSVSKLYF